MLILGIAAIIVRTIAACIRAGHPGIARSVFGGAACGVAVWIAAGVAGSWSPLGPAAALGVVAGLGALAFAGLPRIALWSLGDIVVFLAMSQLSVPPLDLGVIAIGAVCVGGAGLVLDVAAARGPTALRAIALLAGAIIGTFAIAFATNLPWSLRDDPAPPSIWVVVSKLANLGIVVGRDPGAARRELSTGAVAWLESPSSGNSPLAALFFHGADAAGSHQPSAIVVRRALRAAGFRVLSVDHPGFGASPSPAGGADIEAWDPMPSAVAALDLLRKDPTVIHVIAVGHSLGVIDALRLLAAGVKLDGIVLFGARVTDDIASNYWRSRFLADRGLAPSALSKDQLIEMLRRFYSTTQYVEKLSKNHSPIVFARFTQEWPDIMSSRDTLFAQIPGVKTTWNVRGSHYFSSVHLGGLVAGDVRVTRDISERFARIAADLRNGGAIACAPSTQGMDRAGRQWEPYIEWRLCNSTYAGNPFDLIASVTFEHEASGHKIATEMFFDGSDTWKFRFTPTHSGTWTFKTTSDDHDLNGHTGRVAVAPNPGAIGFLTDFGSKWGWSGTARAISPQFVMYADPGRIHSNASKIDADIKTFVVEHGFTGFHTVVGCRWFKLESPRCDGVDVPDPDKRTFEALELLIGKVHAAGGAVHIWAWGDEQRSMTPMRWGLNGDEARRLERYIAARLGPLPGWSMGYGFDLFEWATSRDLKTWHEYMSRHMGWPHLLGGRGPTNQLREIYDGLDYASFEQHRPDYRAYRAAMDAAAGRPVFSEDRFRIRDAPTHSAKDYTMEMTRRGLWHSTMAGGVANIWGNLRSGSIVSEQSLPFPRPEWIKSHAEFFRDRFLLDMTPCDDRTDGACLKNQSGTRYVFYKEDAISIELDLSDMGRANRAISVDTVRPYAEIELGAISPSRQTWTAPYRSDWAVAIGDFSRSAAE